MAYSNSTTIVLNPVTNSSISLLPALPTPAANVFIIMSSVTVSDITLGNPSPSSINIFPVSVTAIAGNYLNMGAVAQALVTASVNPLGGIWSNVTILEANATAGVNPLGSIGPNVTPLEANATTSALSLTVSTGSGPVNVNPPITNATAGVNPLGGYLINASPIAVFSTALASGVTPQVNVSISQVYSTASALGANLLGNVNILNVSVTASANSLIGYGFSSAVATTYTSSLSSNLSVIAPSVSVTTSVNPLGGIWSNVTILEANATTSVNPLGGVGVKLSPLEANATTSAQGLTTSTGQMVTPSPAIVTATSNPLSGFVSSAVASALASTTLGTTGYKINITAPAATTTALAGTVTTMSLTAGQANPTPATCSGIAQNIPILNQISGVIVSSSTGLGTLGYILSVTAPPAISSTIASSLSKTATLSQVYVTASTASIIGNASIIIPSAIASTTVNNLTDNVSVTVSPATMTTQARGITEQVMVMAPAISITSAVGIGVPIVKFVVPSVSCVVVTNSLIPFESISTHTNATVSDLSLSDLIQVVIPSIFTTASVGISQVHMTGIQQANCFTMALGSYEQALFSSPNSHAWITLGTLSPVVDNPYQPAYITRKIRLRGKSSELIMRGKIG